ncbi:glycosyltransferase family 2 protein [Campylobacter jejuni]|uniref:glycosyltransferase family 2 protein n=1 Tax=Campylobacter jejuni TaxID=197 RepID=UPI00069A5688|nr:glycosyltransferase family 2 protein [Campylobacter jejuni]EAK0291576.1 glycosyltransferase family 2 protein [Campylobacter jejuni]EAK8154594.1 glycosyltransferase family 2 protein [Campylobacter jejuni]ECK6690677.1 glycosyltransferase family 2 protein [Campylobacter jejuni]ECO2813016.1 glycosyltransferase family 2 protein [Campylobacter jejuni]ECP9479481.1 glycosyltransferase family 2 protein [Campylobacter jejuni]
MSQISIILPTFNVEKYIARALESCINQTFKDIEIIVVDDCGSDKSIDIVKEYAKKDDRIKIIYNEKNLGAFVARNEGVKYSNSQYLMFLDPDDFLELEACEISYKAMVEKESDYVSFGLIRYLDENHIEPYTPFFSGEFNQNELFNFLYQQKYITWNIYARLIRKDKYLKCLEILSYFNLERINCAEDALVTYILLNLCHKFTFLDARMYFYTLNLNSTTQSNDIIKFRNNVNDYTLVINTIKEIAVSNKFNIKIAKLFCFILAFEKHQLNIKINKRLDGYTLKDIVWNFIYKKYYTIRRKFRVILGI